MADDEPEVLEGGEEIAEEEFFPEAGAEIAGVRPELQKLYRQHPELIIDYKETVATKLPLTSVLASASDAGDPKHRTYPFLTLYEKTKIIGLRANQLSQGARPFISVPDYVTDVREIARLELDQKRLPYIIKRPLPSGKFEYWRLYDLLIL
jgi:DNA-directed RNA polymerase subunit K/omega